MTLTNLSADQEARARQSRHEAAVERICAHPWLALDRLSAKEYLQLMTALTGMREAHSDVWDPHTNPGMWFQPGRTQGCIQLGRYWWASVCVVQGPSEHRPWADFIPPNAPCWLSMRLSGDAQARFRTRSTVAGLFERAGNQRIVEASNLLYDLPQHEAVSVSLVGLAGGETPGDAKAAAAELAAQLEAWLGLRVSLSASATSALSLCVPAFVGVGGVQPPIWPATNAQAGMLLPVGRPFSPWQSRTPIRPFFKTKAAFQTSAGNEAPSGYSYNSFGDQPTYVTLVAGQAGSGKSMALSHIAMEFSQRNPQSPVRILDVGNSAAPLAELWRQNGHSVATPDLREVPPINLLQPPFPMTAGGPLQASSIMTLLNLLVPNFEGRLPTLTDRGLKLVWGMAHAGVHEGRDPRAIEDCMKRGDIEGAREAHAAAAPTLRQLALAFATQALAGPNRNDPDAKYLNTSITEITTQHPNLIRSIPTEWMAANRMVAELGGQALMDDPLTPVRYTLGLSLLTGDLAPSDWQLASAPGEASLEYARETAKTLSSAPKLVLCDELHRLQGNKTAETWLERIAREGRKAYLGMLLASQRASDFAPKVVAQASVRIVFSNDPTGPECFDLDPDIIRNGTGRAALYARHNNGLVFQAPLRLQLAPEHLWALGSGARERALVQALTSARKSHAVALSELARRLPSGRLPPDAPPASELIQAWS